MKSAVQTSSPPASRYAVPALGKAVEILELLSTDQRGLTVTQIAEYLDRSVGEIYRILISLEGLGLIQRGQNTKDRYELAMTLFEWAHRHLPTERLAKLAQPILEALSIATKQSAMLAVMQEPLVLVIAYSPSPLSMLLNIRVGTTLPIETSGAGLVGLAYAPQAAFDTVSGLGDRTQRTRMNRALNGVRRASLHRGANPILPGVTDLTAPVFDHRGSVVASITLCYLSQLYADISIDDCEDLLAHAAGELSRQLGGAEFVPAGE